jgi:adenylate kinase
MHSGCNVVLFLGPPGSGKGTQACWLSNYLQVPAVSTGEMLRQEIRSGSPVGRAVSNVLAQGQLVSDSLMNDVLTKRLRQVDCQSGFILDGYPRTASQAAFLDSLLDRYELPDLRVIDFQIPADEVIRRLGRRRQCPKCGKIASVPDGGSGKLTCDVDGSTLEERPDDQPTVIRERLRVYSKIAEQLAAYYRGRQYTRVDAARSPAEISRELASVLRPANPRPRRTRETPAFAIAGL